MSSFERARDNRSFRQVSAYILAVILPILASILVQHVDHLKLVPYSPHFFSMVFIAMLGGLGPALVSILISLVSHNYLLNPAHPRLIPSLLDSLRVSTLVLSALIITLMNTRRHRASDRLENALADLEDRSDALMQSLHSSRCASWTQNIATGESRRWYAGSYPVFGCPFDEVESFPSFESLLHPDDLTRVATLLGQMSHTWTPLNFEYRTIWPNGEIHWLESRGTRVQGYPCLWRGVTVDITERKLAEAALIRSEKLAAMGRLASTVAHEINNPLEAVTNLLFLARADPNLSPETEEWLTTAERELGRLANITRLTLGFVRTSTAHTTADLNLILDEVLSLFRHRFELKNIHITREFDPLIRVQIAPHELRQILTNLISNAADAVTGPDPRVAIHILHDGPLVRLRVEDNGVGIPQSQLFRIFDPFFTTKDDVGTGIGLWVTKELVEKNGGHIAAESGDLPDNMKTRFSLALPIALPTEQTEAADPIPSASSESPSAPPSSPAVF